MIISKTPFRISFFGGGTDYPKWYQNNGGQVISATINKYCFITARYLPPFFSYKHRIRYYINEETQTINDIKHPSVKEVMKFLGINNGIEIVHNADLPARSGLGSSSSFTVGLLNALNALDNKSVSKKELALNAIHIEQNLIKEFVGSQDQTAAAYGGINKISFTKNRIDVDPVIIPKERINLLEQNLFLVFTGFSRTASEIAKKQIKITNKKTKELNLMKDICDQGYKYLVDPKESLDAFGKLLHEQWEIKRSITNIISTTDIDSIYLSGMDSGAIGGKLLGAGGGGFMLFYVPEERQNKFKENMKNKLIVPFIFDYKGSEIIYNDKELINK